MIQPINHPFPYPLTTDVLWQKAIEMAGILVLEVVMVLMVVVGMAMVHWSQYLQNVSDGLDSV